MLTKKNSEMIKNFFKNLREETFEFFLKTLSSVGKITDAARDIKVSIKVQHLIEDGHHLKSIADKAKETWENLFSERSRCQLESQPVNLASDLTFTICEEAGKLVVKVESQYLEEKEVKSEFRQAMEEFVEETNEFLDDLLDRDRSLTIDETLVSSNSTKQVQALSDFFDKKLRKIFFAVLVRKFIAEINK